MNERLTVAGLAERLDTHQRHYNQERVFWQQAHDASLTMDAKIDAVRLENKTLGDRVPYGALLTACALAAIISTAIVLTTALVAGNPLTWALGIPAVALLGVYLLIAFVGKAGGYLLGAFAAIIIGTAVLLFLAVGVIPVAVVALLLCLIQPVRWIGRKVLTQAEKTVEWVNQTIKSLVAAASQRQAQTAGRCAPKSTSERYGFTPA